LEKNLVNLSQDKGFNFLADALASVFTDKAVMFSQRQFKNDIERSDFIYKQLQEVLKSPIGIQLSEIRQSNASLIKNIPLKLAEEIVDFTHTQTYKGLRAEDIASTLKEKLEGYSANKINTIARTEASKAMVQLTEQRAKSVGLNWYTWKTSNDGRVRAGHKHMQDVLVNFNNPPSPEQLVKEKFVGYYNAGNIFNCRCYPSVVVDIDFIKFPTKVFYNGQIVRMSKQQFEKIM